LVKPEFNVSEIGFKYLDKQILNRHVTVKGLPFQGPLEPFRYLNRHRG